MYKITLTCKSKRKRLISNDIFKNVDDAQKSICDHIERQLKDCYKAWGLCDYDVKELNNGYTYIVTYKPCLTLLKNLIIEYQIVEA